MPKHALNLSYGSSTGSSSVGGTTQKRGGGVISFAISTVKQSTILKPVIDMFNEVSASFGVRLYHSLLIRNQKSYYKLLMARANSYEQWASAGYMLDRCEGKDLWKEKEESHDYDWMLLKERLRVLKDIRKKGDVPAMIFNLRTTLSRNLADMGNSLLYEKSHVGTKALIEEYMDEVIKQFNFICDAEIIGMNIIDKLDFMRNVQTAFGRTALLLSGGATFALAHIGTIKALWEQKLLPRVMTGSSAGSIVAGVLCTKTDKEITHLLDPRHINLNFFERPYEQGNPFIMLSRFLKHGVIRDGEVFNECMYDNIGDITFLEAYNRTRRILNITVSSSTNFEMPRLLNYLTAPNVLVRSAIAASSAVPFVFFAAPLMAKDSNKNIVPWNTGGHKWIDGSVEGDLPMQRVRELFGVNHFLVAQANPHIIPFLNATPQPSSSFYRFIKLVAGEVGGELQHRLSQVLDLGLQNTVLYKLHSMISQKYTGDVTIVPYFKWIHFLEIISNPYLKMAKLYVNAGERATWPKIAILRNHCLIEQCISQNITSLRERLVTAHVDSQILSHHHQLPLQIDTKLKEDIPSIRPLSANPIMENEFLVSAIFKTLKGNNAKLFPSPSDPAIEDIPLSLSKSNISSTPRQQQQIQQELIIQQQQQTIRGNKSAGDIRSVLKKLLPPSSIGSNEAIRKKVWIRDDRKNSIIESPLKTPQQKQQQQQQPPQTTTLYPDLKLTFESSDEDDLEDDTDSTTIQFVAKA